MAKDVIITPLDGDIQFENASGTEAGKIEQSGDDLVISNAVGDVLIGDGTADVYVGDGTNNVDIIFEQNGSIKGEDGSSVNLTIGSYDTDLVISGSTLNLQPAGNTTIIGGPLTVTKVSSDQNTAQDSGTIPATTIAETIKIHGGSYTNGQYTTEIVKVDRSGNLPLYVRQSKGTANAFTNLIRIGDHGQTNGTDIFAVFGKARVDGVFTVTGGSIVLGGTGRIQGIDTVSSGTDAANKTYVDTKLPKSGGTMTGVITSDGITSGTTAANRVFQVSTAVSGALHVTAADGGTTGAAHTAPLVTVTGNGSTVQGGIYVSQNSSTGTSLGFFTTDSYATGPQLGLSILDNGVVHISRGNLTLDGTGRIQGIDTVSSDTDAANKLYVDNHTYSHNHDDRYYTETESDGRFLKLTGGTMSGAIDFHQTDSEDIIITGNSSASNANQFFIKHNFAKVDIGNLRDDIFFTSGSVQFTNNIHVGEYIYHKGDTNTFIRLLGDELRIVAGGRNIIKMDEGTDPDKVVLGDSATETYTAGSMGVGTTDPADNAKLTVMNTLTMGIPGAGSSNTARFLSIEGNADASGEGSGRIFFSEHNSTTDSMSKYGMSIGYRGGATTITGADGNDWTGLSAITNGQWGMWGHDADATGALIMYGDRGATYVDFAGNNIQGITDIYVDDQIISTGDTNTYMQFHAADQWRVVTGGSERIEANNTEVRLANNLVIGGTELDLPSGGMIDWANGDARIVEGETNNYSLSFKTYDGSAITTALRLDGDNSALFNGPVTVDSSGSTVLDIQGSQGQLFSVTDDLSGDLFTVADISGVPILNVNASATSSFDGYLNVNGPRIHIENVGNDTTATLKLSGNNNTGTPGVQTSATIEHRGADLKTVLTHNGSDVITIGTGTGVAFAGTATFADDIEAPGIYVGSSNTSYDFYNNGTSYLNGATTIDADTSVNGNVTIDNGTSTTLWVKCDDNGNAIVRASGEGQGTGVFEVGQSTSYGGGMSYNGDNSPAWASGETADRITFYRLNNGTRTEVFAYPYDTDTVTFNGDITVSGGDITLGGTGRIQGIDTVSSGTDAANKTYVDNHTYSHNHDSRYYTETESDDRFLRKFVGTATGLTNSGFTTAFTVAGDNLSSSIRLSIQGTANSVVVANLVDIVVNHSQDIMIESLSGVYTEITIKVISDNNEDFAVQLKTNSANSLTANLEVLCFGNETVTFTNTHSFTGSSLEKTLKPGKFIAGTGGNSGDLRVEGTSYFAGDLNANGGISGLTLANGGISGTNYNITGVNQLEIADPGEGIVFTNGSSGNITFAITDDNDDNILNLSGTGASLQVNGGTRIYDEKILFNAQASKIQCDGDILTLMSGGSSGTYLDISDSSNEVVISSSTDFVPASDNTGTVGTSARTFNNGRFTNFQVDSVLSVRNYIDLADSDGIRFGSSDDFRMFYDGSNNELEMEMESACNRIRITDNTTSRFTLSKDGTFTATGDVVAYSDERVKENIVTIGNALDKVTKLRGVTYNRTDIKDKSTKIGVIAQEIEKVLPEVVQKDEEGMLGVSYGNMVGLLIEGMKEQQSQIEELKAIVNKLQNEK